MVRILKRLVFFWRRQPKTKDSDFGVRNHEPWIERAIQDFEKILGDKVLDFERDA